MLVYIYIYIYIYLIKNSQAVKKGASPKKAKVKKDVKSKVAAKKWLLMVKILITTIQVNFVPRPF